jgi:hypothetical protein
MLRNALAGRTGSLVLDTEFRGKLEGRLARGTVGVNQPASRRQRFRELSGRFCRQGGRAQMLWQNLVPIRRKACGHEG